MITLEDKYGIEDTGNIHSKSWNITFVEVLIDVTSARRTKPSTGLVSKDL